MSFCGICFDEFKISNARYPKCNHTFCIDCEYCYMKVFDQNNNTFRCEKCFKYYDSFKLRYILKFIISDYTGYTWVTCSGDIAEIILGQKATFKVNMVFIF